MNIGDVSRRSGLPAKTIRYYEDIGLIRPLRRENGYRRFERKDVHKLAFLQRARSLGFTIEDCRTLLDLYANRNWESSDMKQITKGQLEVMDEKIRQLDSMRATLLNLIKTCAGDERPDCPILEDDAHELRVNSS